MPGGEHVMREWFGKRPVQIDHQFRNSLFSWPNPALVHSQTELPAERGLDAGAIENLAFNLRCSYSLGTDGFNGNLIAFFVTQMLEGSNQSACPKQKLLLRLDQTSFVPGELRPVGLLPIPAVSDKNASYRSL
jgi:hypothetical protein